MPTKSVAVFAEPDTPALAYMPKGYNFVVGTTPEDFDGVDFDSVVYIFPAPISALINAWPQLSSSATWIHSFWAGVDACAPFFNEYLIEDGKKRDANVKFTNGKGAFSDSLAEYTLAAALHFNKRIPRCQANKAAKRWEKFVMPTISGKTMGFLGFGHIAKCTARAAKGAFNMKVVASRRNPHADNEGLVDQVYSTDEMERVFEESDFVVSVLPGTPETINLITDRHFDKMKPGSVFISIGRGVVVDEDALLRALRKGKLLALRLMYSRLSHCRRTTRFGNATMFS